MANWRGGIKRDKYDTVFSGLVRERVDWVCEFCGVDYKHDTGRLHCSHLFGRRGQGLRLHPQNAFAHCYRCHPFLEENPVLFAEWAKERLGRRIYDKLQFLASRPTKWTPGEKEIIHRHYLAELKRLKTCRAAGMRGRIDFTLPEAA